MFVDPGAISTTEATGEVRISRPNVTIDQSQLRHERNLRLKASRSAAKGVVTRRQNEAREIVGFWRRGRPRAEACRVGCSDKEL